MYRNKMCNVWLFIFTFIFCSEISAISYPLEFSDDQGNEIVIKECPLKVVSLVPSVTEIIYSIGAGDALNGITYYSTFPPETSKKEIVGGFFSPSVERIEEIEPDIIFYSSLQDKVIKKFGHGKCQLVNIEVKSISDAYDGIALLGRIFNKEVEASGIVVKIKDQLDVIGRKTAAIPLLKRKRVIRLMGRDQVMTPGDDSFQNEFIRLAGGIPPKLNKTGNVVEVTKEEWISFNPQVIYGCGGDRKTAEMFFSLPGWKDVDAVKNRSIYYFPCELTCRAATNTGYFVSWLSSRIYSDEFSNKENLVFKEQVFDSRKLDIDVDYVRDIRISDSYVYDFVNKTLIIDFKEPMSIVSTLEGLRTGIKSVGNHYSPLACWAIGHKNGFKGQRDRVYKIIGMSENDSSFLFTGANIDNLAVKRKAFNAIAVYALVTAGVKSNAIRMSADKGMFYEPGTINIIILSNMKLTSRAMTRAIISATEGKTAALQDLDIRSSYTSLVNQATGTGTDNIIVVEGKGRLLDNAGGHSKLGELVAKAVYEGIQEAVYKQNGLVAERNIFQRLKDRNITMFGLMSGYECECNVEKFEMVGILEEILLQPFYSSFVSASLSMSDDYERGLIADLSSYRSWCKSVAEKIAGKEIDEMLDLLEVDALPKVLKMSFNAILNGIHYRVES